MVGLSLCHTATQPTTHQSKAVEFDIIYEDKRLQPVTACIMCVFADEDAQLAASDEAIPTYVALFQVFSQPPLATSASARQQLQPSTLLSLGPVQPSGPTHIGQTPSRLREELRGRRLPYSLWC
ncbi:hypothetical protein M405DRAFT_576197 [Rhizopogon salebrosus TDB-379]|nr:hypothetical protein M405DRAFT_576197 [Rhizopogon salebrosus TDB-379]